ncbi:MAG: type II secretory pathway, component PulD [Verrucomicrobia bacterium]|nr:type II secretory pathway, component PulD [Verrucomicrobiota bacterium]
MNYTKLPKKVLLLLATPVIFSLTVPAGRLIAQSQTETKIRLMAEGLRARDSGDLATAKNNFEQLLVLAPTDITVQRLLNGVNENLAKPAVVETPAPAVVTPSADVPEVVYDPSATGPAKPAKSKASKSETDKATDLAKAEDSRVKDLIAAAKSQVKEANKQAKSGDYEGANTKLDAAIRTLPVNTMTEDTIKSLTSTKNALLLQKSQDLLAKNDTDGAKAALDAYVAATSPSSKPAVKQAKKIDAAELDPGLQPIEKVSTTFIPEQKEIAKLTAKGRSQYVAGDIDGAQDTFRMIETISPENPESKYFLKRIADEKARLGDINREKTRSTMLEEVAKSWQRPGVFVERNTQAESGERTGSATLTNKLNNIIIPSVAFTGVELGKVINTLAAYSEEFDKTPGEIKGVNIVLGNQLAGSNVPSVNITLRNMTLKRVLDIITENVGYQYEVQADLVLVKPSGTDANLLTEEFAVSKSALTRMTGVSGGASASSAASSDPFAAAPAAGSAASGGGESDSIKRFLSAAGVPFESVPGASLAYDGSRILVTHTNRNIERIRNIIGRYNDVRQVEIEAKFIDVQAGDLNELGIQWGAKGKGSPQFDTTTGAPLLDSSGNQVVGNYKRQVSSGNRTLSDTFSASTSANQGSITTNTFNGTGTTTSNRTIANSAPTVPGAVTLGALGGATAAFTEVIGDFDVTATLRALSQKSSSELLSSPKVTVLSGNMANITVAQELRYPQSYGETQSQVGTSSAGATGGSAGVTITPGTPQDFTTRNVGVELKVTPTVEEDDYSISLDLNPRVTEFEGFIEYGGQSVGISSGTTVITPSGFYQPIFALREITTKVTVWDGATLVMGGLTREEVKRVSDKVPILGDIPYLGRAFRSKGETSQKRNLLIFVTANLVSPGGSLKKQELRGISPSSTFQNPTVVTPSSSESRIRSQ